jgi:hypothetical protein
MEISLAFVVKLFFFGFSLWLGSYLLARKSEKNATRFTGWGLVAYSIVLAVEILLGQVISALALLPALLWIGAALHLIPEETAWRASALRVWMFSLIPILILALVTPWISIAVVIAMLVCAVIIIRLAASSYFKNTYAVIGVIALFFGLSTGLLVLPNEFISSFWGIFLLGFDLLLLGFAVAVWDAFDEGETIRHHLTRSFVSAFYYAGALSALVVIASAIEDDFGFAKLLLLLCLIAFGILTQTFERPIKKLLDDATFPRSSTLGAERDLLNDSADALPLLSTLDLFSVSDAEFTRLTRRALSHMGDLPRLSSNPLVNLPQAHSQNTLERAHALKALLTESVEKLKPRGGESFGTSDAWRHYNAVYYPYVLGLKPYARRADLISQDESTRVVLEWFQASVPERTLHNWQNTAAKLIAEDIKKSLAPT